MQASPRLPKYGMVTPVLNTPSRRRDTFVGWLAHTLLGLLCIGAGLEAASVFGRLGWHVVLACALSCAVGLAVIVRAELRERPQRLLRKVRRTLSFPAQWSVKFDKRIVRSGTIPVAVIRADGVRFVIDIRADKCVSWGTPVDGSGNTPLVGADGKRLKPDPVAPLLQSALLASAAPVLWLPQATTAKNLRHPESNLIVVMGTARDLKHALQGAEIAPIRRIKKKTAALRNEQGRAPPDPAQVPP